MGIEAQRKKAWTPIGAPTLPTVSRLAFIFTYTVTCTGSGSGSGSADAQAPQRADRAVAAPQGPWDGAVSRAEELKRRIARVRPSRVSGYMRPPRIFWKIVIDWR